MMTVILQESWAGHRKGTPLQVPEHLASALCDSPGPNGPPVAKRSGIDFEEMTVAELKAELRDRGLSPTGNKAALVARLQE